MKLIASLFLALLLIFPLAAVAEDAVQYGEGVALDESVAIADILADPEAWSGKEVRVEGRVVGVCPRKGCWIAIESRDHAQVRIKVDDDVIVFPPEAEGRWAIAQGTVSVREMSREQWVSWQSHLAEEKGEEFDAASIGEGPFQSVQIQSKGAEIVAETAAE